jgi:REP element-mobilizing transposase RayT
MPYRRRNVRAGKTWLVTRRVTRRHFLLRPDEDGTLDQLYWYATAVIARALGIEIHSVQVLSNHMHEVMTDPFGLLPRFFELRNRLLANAIKCYRGWPEEVFSKTPASEQWLETPQAIVKEIAYVTTNCVTVGRVHLLLAHAHAVQPHNTLTASSPATRPSWAACGCAAASSRRSPPEAAPR